MPITEGMIIAGLAFLKFLIDKYYEHKGNDTSKLLTDLEHEKIRKETIDYLIEKGLGIGNIDDLVGDLEILTHASLADMHFFKFLFEQVWQAEESIESLNSGVIKHEYVKEILDEYMKSNDINADDMNADDMITEVVALINKHNLFFHAIPPKITP